MKKFLTSDISKFLKVSLSLKKFFSVLLSSLIVLSCKKDVSDSKNLPSKTVVVAEGEKAGESLTASSALTTTEEKYDITSKVKGVIFPPGNTKIHGYFGLDSVCVKNSTFSKAQGYSILSNGITYAPTVTHKTISFVPFTIWTHKTKSCEITVIVNDITGEVITSRKCYEFI